MTQLRQHLLESLLTLAHQPERTREAVARFGHRVRVGRCSVTGRRVAKTFNRGNHFLSAEGSRGSR